MMPVEGGNLENLLERVVQMNMVIIEEMQEQRKQFNDQQALLSSRLSVQSSATPTSTTAEALIDPSLRLINKIHVKPKEYNGTNDENVVTWLIALEEVMANRLVHDDERISLAVSLLGGTALQWFVNLKLKNRRRSSWSEFKDQLTSQFQPADFQENLRQQLLQLRQKQSFQDYVYAFRGIVGQINAMDELTQVMFFINGLSSSTSLYVRSKHPQTVEAAIREATTYDNVTAISKNNHVKYDSFLEQSSRVELNAINTRQNHATGKTPFYMVYGVEAKLPGDELIPIVNDDEQNNIINRAQQLNQLVQQRDIVHQRLKSNAIKMKTYYDHHLRHHADELQQNDWVLIHNENRKKFQPHWIGPYKIRKICPLGTYQLEDVKGQVKLDLVHRDMLKRAHLNSIPTQQWYKSSRRNNNHRLV